ncbi:MAG: hypothetical protein FWD68_08865, partial [Alphaproteobacteria bacterium]|nr:hypothetical protein [Alphaproteobacteria bacterium]
TEFPSPGRAQAGPDVEHTPGGGGCPAATAWHHSHDFLTDYQKSSSLELKMTFVEPLYNLVSIGLLNIEPPDQTAFHRLVSLGTIRLKDAHSETNSAESRFDLTFNAAHSLAADAMAWLSPGSAAFQRVSGAATWFGIACKPVAHNRSGTPHQKSG